MKLAGLIWANIFRNKIRTLLTLGSLTMAFVLFGFLQALSNAFSAGADFVGASRLIVQSRTSFTQALPMSQLRQIEQVPGVANVNYSQWFGGVYQSERNFFPQFATDPERLFKTYPEWVLSDAEKQRFKQIRASALVGRQIANRFGWKVGDRVPLTSTIWGTQSGDKAWSFEVAGIFDGVNEEWQNRTGLMYLNFDYFDEEREVGRGLAGIFIVQLSDANRAEEVAKTIDAIFKNSANETKTQTEKEFNLGFFRQLGDIGLLTRYVLFAVFFSILLVVGNTIAQGVRERIPELAVLKTLGFTDAAMLWSVFAEAAALCLMGAIAGMSLAAAALAALSSSLQLPFRPGDPSLWLQALACALVMAFLVGVLPALRAQRLKIVDALAGR